MLWQNRLYRYSQKCYSSWQYTFHWPHESATCHIKGTHCPLQYAKFVLRVKYAADEATDRCMSWHLKCIRMIAAVCVSPTSEMLCANCLMDLQFIAQELCLAHDFTKNLSKPQMSKTAPGLLRC